MYRRSQKIRCRGAVGQKKQKGSCRGIGRESYPRSEEFPVTRAPRRVHSDEGGIRSGVGGSNQRLLSGCIRRARGENLSILCLACLVRYRYLRRSIHIGKVLVSSCPREWDSFVLVWPGWHFCIPSTFCWQFPTSSFVIRKYGGGDEGGGEDTCYVCPC